MAVKTIYKCNVCNDTQIAWSGKCVNCGAWNSLEEIKLDKKKAGRLEKDLDKKSSRKLREVNIDTSSRILSGVDEFDRTIGGGLVRDSVSILTAKPGIGKSTLLLELAYKLAKKDFKLMYISGEESESQIKQRASRIMDDIPEHIYILSTNSMDLALEEIKRIEPKIIFLDSIQTLSLAEYSQRAGSPTQTIECANAFVDICKDPSSPKAGIMIGHMTKSDQLAGLMTLEHLVDTVLYLEGETDSPLRILRTTKNRFGYTGEIGIFSMGEDGLKELSNPSEYFITQRQKDIEGAAISVIREGSRIITVEVESLVSQSFTPYPIRIGDSLRKDQLNTLISILEERSSFNLYDKNVILKTTGGLKLSEQSVNLAIIVSIVSSIVKKPVSSKSVFIAEVGLTGELKRVPLMDQRLQELDRMGFEKAYIAKNKLDLKKLKNLEVIQLNDINEVLKDLFA
ncbi:MAG: DNA repair protein RadA [Tissierellia bacterium]|nr:DNA repair protein RadA [Tissierellia bacterium]